MTPLPDSDHVARYCKPSSVDESGRPMTSAFAMRSGEAQLSVNWLEYFDSQRDVGVYRVRETLVGKAFQLRHGGRFAVLDVGVVKAAVKRHLDGAPHINHLPREDDPSHAGVFGHGEADFAVAAELRACSGLSSDQRRSPCRMMVVHTARERQERVLPTRPP